MKFGISKERILISLLIIILISILPQVKANPVVITIWDPYTFLELVFLFIITFIVEGIILMLFLKPVSLKKTTRKFYKSVFAVNLVTYPLTQIFAFLFNTPYVPDYSNFLFTSIAIEVFPISLECLLNVKIYNKFNELSYFENRVNNRIIIKSTLTANLVTFAIGFSIFIFF
ncbi:MAG: hypothetical protein ACFFE5_04185 [Candidatus Thorarchaeota archaeon]